MILFNYLVVFSVKEFKVDDKILRFGFLGVCSCVFLLDFLVLFYVGKYFFIFDDLEGV